jgi:tRNA G10  N-methylase Trm11
MMTKLMKKALDTAVDELKRGGYAVLVVMLDQKSDESKPMGSGVEVLCSETNDPKLLAAMLQTTLEQLSSPGVADHRIN